MNRSAYEKNASGKREYPLSLYLDIVMAVCAAFALALDMNVRSGNNYVNWAESLPGTPVVTVLFAAILFALRRAREALPKTGAGTWTTSLFLGAWWVLAKSVANTQELNQPFLSSGQMLKTLVITLGMACLYNLFFRLMAYALEGKWDWDTKALRGTWLADFYRRHTTVFCAAAVLLMWLPHILISYPCAMNRDTASQVNQALGLEPRMANHPPFGTWLLEVAIGAGRVIGSGNAGLYLYVLLQCLFGALVIGYSQRIMCGLCAPRWLRVLSLAVCGLMPVYCENIAVLVKDIPYSYAALLLMCEAARYGQLHEESYGAKAGFALRVTIAGVILLNIRNNGLAMMAPAALCLLISAVKRSGRKGLVRMAVVAALPFLISACIENALMNGVNEVQQRSPREALSLPFQQTARFVREHGDEIPQEERDAIDAVLLYNRIGDFYNPVLSDPVKATYKENATAQELARYFAVWAKQFWRDPACYIKATLIQNALLFDPQTYNVAIFTETELSSEAEQALGVYEPQALSRLEDVKANLRRMLFTVPLAAQLNSVGFYCIVLLGALDIKRRHRIKGMNIYFLPMLITLLMIVLGPCIEHQDRYGFPIVYCMPLLLACLSGALNKKDNTPGECV